MGRCRVRRLSEWVADDIAKQARWYDSPGGPLRRGRDLVAASKAGVDVTGGAEGLSWIGVAAGGADLVAAWGAHPMAAEAGPSLIRERFPTRRVLCIGRTVSGAPRHPLMAAYTDAPEVYLG